MLKPVASPPTSSEKKPVKKLFDRPAVGKETKTPPANNTADTPDNALPKKIQKPQKQLKTSELDGLIEESKSPSVYGLAMLVLILLILWTGVLIVEQVQNYHGQYAVLQKLKHDYRSLEIEHQRLLIEQQTFSATPQIAKRAVAELNMYYPQLSDRLILQANSPQNSQPQSDNAPIVIPNHTTTSTMNRTDNRPAQPKPAANTSTIQNSPVANPVNQEATR